MTQCFLCFTLPSFICFQLKEVVLLYRLKEKKIQLEDILLFYYCKTQVNVRWSRTWSLELEENLGVNMQVDKLSLQLICNLFTNLSLHLYGVEDQSLYRNGNEE